MLVSVSEAEMGISWAGLRWALMTLMHLLALRVLPLTVRGKSKGITHPVKNLEDFYPLDQAGVAVVDL